jgi:hypothetical protein
VRPLFLEILLTTPLAPVTELIAVNRMLHDLSERPVVTLSGSSRFDVVQAIDSLNLTVLEFLSTGWFFNEEQMRLTADVNGNYNIPADTTNVRVVKDGPTTGTEGTPTLVVRAQKLYDTTNGTDVFVAAGSILLKVHRLITFEDMPTSAREYCYAAATVVNQERTLGSKNIDQNLVRRARAAFAIVHNEDLKAKNSNQQLSNHFFDLMFNR